jgi:hypothetical protein
MDILLENVPQMLPDARHPLSELSEFDPFEIVATMYQPGMSVAAFAFALDVTDLSGVYPLSQACVEVMHRFMASLDDTSALIGIAMAHTLEDVMIECCTPRNKDDHGSIIAVMQLQNCAQLLKDMLTDHQTYINSRRKHDLKRNHSTEMVERAWAALIKNKANLNEFKQGRPDTAYLEARKIFLPQGATLILEYWQHELNAFVSELESVSISIPLKGRHWEFCDLTDTS